MAVALLQQCKNLGCQLAGFRLLRQLPHGLVEGLQPADPAKPAAEPCHLVAQLCLGKLGVLVKQRLEPKQKAVLSPRRQNLPGFEYQQAQQTVEPKQSGGGAGNKLQRIGPHMPDLLLRNKK